MRAIAASVAAFLASACGPGLAGGRNASDAAVPVPPVTPGHREFAVFAQREFLLDAIGVPVEAPLTVGSLASPATMASDAPEVVAVAIDGRLVARKTGRARIRGVGSGSVLEVEVGEKSEATAAARVVKQLPPEARP